MRIRSMALAKRIYDFVLFYQIKEVTLGMPSEKILKQKQQMVAELTEKLKNATSGVIVDYKGINVAQDTDLRRRFREANVEYAVIKNTLLRFAVKEADLEGLSEVLEGTTALAISNDDPVAPAKTFKNFLKDNAALEIDFKSGFVDGKVLSVDEIKDLADLPPKEVLVAKVLGGLNSPIAGLANVLNGNIRGLAVALNAVAEKKQAAGE